MHGIRNLANAGATWDAAMRRGDFAAALAVADAVLAARDPATRDDPRLPYHRRWVWDGRPVEGRRVLVRCYHGLGDTLHFARYLKPLRARAAHVTLEAQPALLPLLRALPGCDALIPFNVAAPAPAWDCDIEIMELPHALRLGPSEVPPATLSRLPPATPAADAALCWRAGDWDTARSVPLAPLLAALRPRAAWSLQRGPAAREAAGPPFLNPADDDPDILRTAALILAARRVVTVDTMVAHLAGTLGATTTLLLRARADWRWGNTDRTPWYPSLRLLRQHQDGDWTAPLRAVAETA